jgi:death-on-curing family protein
LRFDEVVFLEVEDVLAAHEAALDFGGGDEGILNYGLLDSATMRPRCGYYGSIAEMAAVYAMGIAKNHAFADANKRTATIAFAKFLGANGFDVTLGRRWSALMVAVANDDVSLVALTNKITELMGGDPVEIEDVDDVE